LRAITSTENLVHADRAARTQPACWDQRLGFGCEPRSSRDMPQFGKICSMEYATKAGLCRRLARRVNMIASKNPVKAPSNASVIERLLKVRSPWPVRRNPVYAILAVQRITRTGCMGDHLLVLARSYVPTVEITTEAHAFHNRNIHRSGRRAASLEVHRL
jgi:hypothetical protein